MMLVLPRTEGFMFNVVMTTLLRLELLLSLFYQLSLSKVIYYIQALPSTVDERSIYPAIPPVLESDSNKVLGG